MHVGMIYLLLYLCSAFGLEDQPRSRVNGLTCIKATLAPSLTDEASASDCINIM